MIFSEGADPDGRGGDCSAAPRRPGVPLTKQRSPWVDLGAGQAKEVSALIGASGGRDVAVFARAVHDGNLTAVRSLDPAGWHLSVSHTPRRAHGSQRAAQRYPTWDELAHARYELLPADIDVVMHLPPPEDYLAVHDTCFHLHQHPAL